MILPFIKDSLIPATEPDRIIPVSENGTENKNENFSPQNAVQNIADLIAEEEDSFETKYKKLMHMIEKERFERELIAGSR
ncbi:MAG: hypothetical protein ABI543_08490 [Ignavibacteria bacterium]